MSVTTVTSVCVVSRRIYFSERRVLTFSTLLQKVAGIMLGILIDGAVNSIQIARFR